MPTQENSEAFHSGSATKTGKKSGMSAHEALAVEKQSSSGTSKPSEMTKAEALAVAWTGIEALAVMKQANLFHSPKTGRVWIELIDVELTSANGLKALAVEAK